MMMKAAVAAVMLLAVVSVRGEQAVGTAAPAFSLKDLKGADVTMAQQRGKVVLVNFWATWCGPCKAEMPILVKLQKVHGPAGLVVLGISMDEEGASVINPWLKKTKFVVDGKESPMNFPLLIGTPQVGTAFGEIEALPATFIIDRQGKIVQRIDGPIEFKDVDKTVKPLLAAK
jgi:thiol-disulfide isomerase/thioredoxin